MAILKRAGLGLWFALAVSGTAPLLGCGRERLDGGPATAAKPLGMTVRWSVNCCPCTPPQTGGSGRRDVRVKRCCHPRLIT
jgi:hypothetical protein